MVKSFLPVKYISRSFSQYNGGEQKKKAKAQQNYKGEEEEGAGWTVRQTGGS